MTSEDNPKKTSSISELVKEVLATQIGVEPDDIDEEDMLSDDLHMSPTDVSDFVGSLTTKGLDTKDLELTKIETVSDIIEGLSSIDLTN